MSGAVDAVVAFYEGLQPETIPRLREIYAADARFRDPFNDVVGHAAIERIFAHMFEHLDAPSFRVTGCIADGRRAALEWRFTFVLRARRFEVVGASVLDFDEDGRVRAHRDYWDVAEELYAKLPGVGPMVRWLGRRMSAAAT